MEGDFLPFFKFSALRPPFQNTRFFPRDFGFRREDAKEWRAIFCHSSKFPRCGRHFKTLDFFLVILVFVVPFAKIFALRAPAIPKKRPPFICILYKPHDTNLALAVGDGVPLALMNHSICVCLTSKYSQFQGPSR
jgi:hypothetical protein